MKPFRAEIGAFMEPTQGFAFDTLDEAAGWFFRQMAAYAPGGVLGRRGKLVQRTDSGEEVTLAEFDFPVTMVLRKETT